MEDELDREQSTDRPIFTLPRGVSKTGWVVVVSEKTIQAAPMNRAQKPLLFAGDAGVILSDSPAEQFLAWANRRDGRSNYLLILLRPGGLDVVDTIENDLTAGGISYGLDLIGADEAVLDPVRGAAP